MANFKKSNPWLLDTAEAVSSDEIYVHQFEWIGYTDAGHDVILKDAKGNIVWQENGATDLNTLRSGKVGWIHGLDLDTLDSGKVLVYIK